MKLLSKDTCLKKIKLIEGLNISSSYGYWQICSLQTYISMVELDYLINLITCANPYQIFKNSLNAANLPGIISANASLNFRLNRVK